MILPRFDVLVPETVHEACVMLAEHADRGARILAGGTDLLVDLRHPIIPQHVPRCDGCATHQKGGILTTVACEPPGSDPLMTGNGPMRASLKDPRQASPDFLISLHKIKQLRGIHPLTDGGVKIGALTTITDIERSLELRNGWTALSEGADNLGSPLVRNRGTIGGNIANARPAADTFIPTIALGGRLLLKGVSGTRTIPSESFATGPGESIIKTDEILTEIQFPPPAPYSGSSYYKLANRKALEISTVGVAVWLTLEDPNGPISNVRVGLGAVGPTPLLAKSVQEVLMGSMPTEAALNKAAVAAASDARPIDDHRGSAWYRVQMVELLTRRLLEIALQRARGKQ
jgi:CO/xanthine dehydrogenase FAD-binding subunit